MEQTVEYEATDSTMGETVTKTATGAVNLRSAWLHCDLEFTNLTLNRTKGDESSNFNSNNNTLTFGEGLITNFASYTIADVVGSTTNNIVIKSGTYKDISSYYGFRAMYNTSTNYNLKTNIS